MKVAGRYGLDQASLAATPGTAEPIIFKRRDQLLLIREGCKTLNMTRMRPALQVKMSPMIPVTVI